MNLKEHIRIISEIEPVVKLSITPEEFSYLYDIIYYAANFEKSGGGRLQEMMKILEKKLKSLIDLIKKNEGRCKPIIEIEGGD